MRIHQVLCWATALVVSGLLLSLAPAGAQALGDDDLAAVHAGGYTNCTNGTPTNTACNTCSNKQRCDSTTISNECSKYSNQYACMQCDFSKPNCGGSLLIFNQVGCAGPSTNGGNCASTWVQTTSQNCAGTCP